MLEIGSGHVESRLIRTQYHEPSRLLDERNSSFFSRSFFARKCLTHFDKYTKRCSYVLTFVYKTTTSHRLQEEQSIRLVTQIFTEHMTLWLLIMKATNSHYRIMF